MSTHEQKLSRIATVVLRITQWILLFALHVHDTVEAYIAHFSGTSTYRHLCICNVGSTMFNYACCTFESVRVRVCKCRSASTQTALFTSVSYLTRTMSDWISPSSSGAEFKNHIFAVLNKCTMPTYTLLSTTCKYVQMRCARTYIHVQKHLVDIYNISKAQLCVALQPHRRSHLRRLLLSYPTDPAYQWRTNPDLGAARAFIDHVRGNIKERTKFTSVGLEEICLELDLPVDSDGRVIHNAIRQLDRGKAFQQWNMLGMKMKALVEKQKKLQSKLEAEQQPSLESSKPVRIPNDTIVTYASIDPERAVTDAEHTSHTPHLSIESDECSATVEPLRYMKGRKVMNANAERLRETGHSLKDMSQMSHRSSSASVGTPELVQKLAHIKLAVAAAEKNLALAKQRRNSCATYLKHKNVSFMWQAVNGRYRNGEQYKYRGEIFEQHAYQAASQYLLGVLQARNSTEECKYTIITNQVWSKRKIPASSKHSDDQSAGQIHEAAVPTSDCIPQICKTQKQLTNGGNNVQRKSRGGVSESGVCHREASSVPSHTPRPRDMGVETHNVLSDALKSHNDRLLRNGKGDGEADIVAVDSGGLVVGIVEVKSGCLAIADAYYQQVRHMDIRRTEGGSASKKFDADGCDGGCSKGCQSNKNQQSKLTSGRNAIPQTNSAYNCTAQHATVDNDKTGECEASISQPSRPTLGGRTLHPSGVVVLVATLLPPNRYAIGCPPGVLHAYTRALTKYDLWHTARLTEIEVKQVMDFVNTSLKQPLSPLQWLDKYGEGHLLIL